MSDRQNCPFPEDSEAGVVIQVEAHGDQCDCGISDEVCSEVHFSDQLVSSYSIQEKQEQNRFGIKITSMGTFTQTDLQTMVDWHGAHEILEGMADLVLWVLSSKYGRISLPAPFNDCTLVPMRDFASQLETLELHTEVPTVFGPIAKRELQWFRRDEWFQDSTIKIVMGCLQQLGEYVLGISIGAVNLMYAHLSEPDAQKELISSSDAFMSNNKTVLLPMWSASHWCTALSSSAKGLVDCSTQCKRSRTTTT